jgi:putative transposase
MRHRLYYHLVWTTRDRAPLIDAPRAELLSRLLRTMALEERARVLEAGMVSTHVHLLLSSHPMTNLPRLVQRLKGATTYVINRELRNSALPQLHWNQGYNIETVARTGLDQLRAYLRHQPQHHPDQAIADWTGDQPLHEQLR